MKILIMVLSYNESPYKELMQAQQETWDSIEVEGVRTVYYYGGHEAMPDEKILAVVLGKTTTELICGCTDSYYYMSQKFQIALEFVKDWDYDIIFRTNSSSYVNKQRLKEFAETLPKEKLYAGWTVHDSNSEDKGMCVSGAGIWLSRDTAEILRNEIDPNFEQEEDVYCGRILRKHGIIAIDEQSRYDYPQNNLFDSMTERLRTLYHIRFKTTNRIQDANNMRFIHQKNLQ